MTQPAFDEFDAELDGFPLAEEEPEKGGGDVLERLASRYVAKVRQGELPETEGFAAEHPELAAELEELLPIAQALEQWKTQKEAECLRQNRPAEFSRFGNWAIAKSSAKSAGAEWAWCLKLFKDRGNAGSPSKCCPGNSAKLCPNGNSGLSARPRRSPSFGTKTSCRFTPSASTKAIAIT